MIKYVIEYMNNIKRVRLKNKRTAEEYFGLWFITKHSSVCVGEGGIKLSSQPRMQMQDKVHTD